LNDRHGEKEGKKKKREGEGDPMTFWELGEKQALGENGPG